jgi:photosystem II stability/assembly factor-like uncharacterized protein
MKLIFKLSFFCAILLLPESCKKEDSYISPPIPSPQPVTSKWTLENLGKPLADSKVLSITIHPKDENLWFVTSENGAYVTTDGGKNWVQFLNGFCGALEIDRKNPTTIYASLDKAIYLSNDNGKTWSVKYSFPKQIVSILVSEKDNSVYVGIRWEDYEMANGIYKSADTGNTWQHYSYNVSAKGLIAWDIEEDVQNNLIYVATEIYNHPQPYNPPFLKSSDGGKTWEDISGILPWHSIKIQIHPLTHGLYALLEGPGMYYSTDFGDSWIHMQVPFAGDLLIDKKNPDRFFGGQVKYGGLRGGVYRSDNGGNDFELAGLGGYTSGGLSLDPESTSLYIACYGNGIFRIKNQ